jgi:hypothetical protein
VSQPGAMIERMFDTVRALREDLREVVDALDPDALDGTLALRLLDEFVAMEPVVPDGVTSLENCCRLCTWHHYLCTHKGWRVEGTPGNFLLVPPTARAPDNRAPPDGLRLVG